MPSWIGFFLLLIFFTFLVATSPTLCIPLFLGTACTIFYFFHLWPLPFGSQELPIGQDLLFYTILSLIALKRYKFLKAVWTSPVSLFLCYILFVALTDIFLKASWSAIAAESRHYLFFTTFFFFFLLLRSNQTLHQTLTWVLGLAVVGVLIRVFLYMGNVSIYSLPKAVWIFFINPYGEFSKNSHFARMDWSYTETFAFSFYLAIFLFIIHRRSWLYVGISILLLIEMFLSARRSIFISILIPLTIFFSLERYKIRASLSLPQKKTLLSLWPILTIFLIFFLVLLLPTPLHNRFNLMYHHLWDGALDPSFSTALHNSINCLNAVKATPLLGIGFGQRLLTQYNYMNIAGLIFEIGLVGLGIYFFMFYHYIRKLYHVFKTSNNRFHMAWACGGLSFLSFQIIDSCFDIRWYFPCSILMSSLVFASAQYLDRAKVLDSSLWSE